MPELQLNYFAVLVAAVAQLILGSVWYSPLLFGKTWMSLVGKSEEQLKARNPAKAYIGTSIGALVTSFSLSLFIYGMGASTFWDGCVLGFSAWLGFVATASLDDILFAGRPFKLFLLNNGFRLCSMLLMSVILTVSG